MSTYSGKMDAFLQEERRIQSIGGSLSRFDQEIVELGVDVLRGRLDEAHALKRLGQIEEERQRLRLYHPFSVRQAVAEVRAERGEYANSREGKAAQRAEDEQRLREVESDSTRAERFQESVRARAEERERAEREEAKEAERARFGAHQQHRRETQEWA